MARREDEVEGKLLIKGAWSTPAGEDQPPQQTDEKDGFRDLFRKKKKAGPDALDSRGKVTSGGSQASDVSPQQPQDNTVSSMVVDLSYEYDMSKRKRAFIFVNEHFNPDTKQKVRGGAQYDLMNYSNIFKHLGFEIEAKYDRTTSEMLKIVHDYAKEKNHNDESCVAFAFSTHGDEDILDQHRQDSHKHFRKQNSLQEHESKIVTDVIYGKDGVISSRSLMEEVSNDNCKSMANKPKLFFFQACRGHNLDEVLSVDSQGIMQRQKSLWIAKNKTIVDNPLQKDFFAAYSAPPGFYSWRRSSSREPGEVGSWFVLALQKAVQDRGREMDLTDIMTIVSDSMAHEEKFTSNVTDPDFADFDSRRVVPFITSMLVKSVRFRKG